MTQLRPQKSKVHKLNIVRLFKYLEANNLEVIGLDTNVQPPRLLLQAKGQNSPDISINPNPATFAYSVHCQDDPDQSRHFTKHPAALAYANQLLAQGHKALLRPYQTSATKTQGANDDA